MSVSEPIDTCFSSVDENITYVGKLPSIQSRCIREWHTLKYSVICCRTIRQIIRELTLAITIVHEWTTNC